MQNDDVAAYKNIEDLKKYGMNLSRIDSCKLVTVIKLDYMQGEGTKENPIKLVTEYRNLDGVLINKVTS